MRLKRLIPLLLLPALGISCAREQFGSGQAEETAPGVSGLTFNVSLPDTGPHPIASKTMLGEYDEGKYPTYWSAGDAISINGVVSNEVPEELDGNRTVPFTFDGVLSAPYNALYPATDEQDVFAIPAEQQFAEETFDPAAVPMYGTGGYDDMQMKHLTSLLSFNVVDARRETSLKKVMVLACAGEVISGKFRMGKDEQQRFDGTFTPVEGIPSITMNFDPMPDLDSKGLKFFVAVPAGTYSGGFSFILFDEDDNVMTLSYKREEGGYVLEPSKVIEFPEVQFEKSASTTVIETAEDLLEMASGDGKGKYLQLEDIDLSGLSYTPLSSFSGEYEGTGHSITGLTTPLFKTLSGSVQNLTVEADVKVTEKSVTSAGILVNEMTSGSSVKRCTVKGSLVYESGETQTSTLNVGGLAGKATSARISDCSVYASVTITDKQKVTSGNVYLGGVIGYDSSGTISGCEAHGIVTNALRYDYTAYNNKSHNNGGIVGYMSNTKSSGNVNSGRVVMTASAMNTVTAGGIAGAIKGSSAVSDGDVNRGEVYFSPIGETTACARYLQCGGLFGRAEDNATVKNGLNDSMAAVWYDNQYTDTYGANIGGVIGVNFAFASYLVNKGTVRTTGASVTRSSSARGLFVGGVLGNHCHTKGGGQAHHLTNEGLLDIVPLFSYKWNVIGAVIGSMGEIDNSKIASSAAQLSATADSKVYIHRKHDDKPLFVGGLVGNAYQNIPGSLTDSESHGQIISEGMINTDKSKRTAVTDRNAFGGLIGRVYCSDSGYKFELKDCSSDVDMTFTKAEGSVRLSLGGAIGLVEATNLDAENIVTGGSISFNDNAETISFGGQVGAIWYTDADHWSKVNWKNCTSTTAISLKENGKLSKHPVAGGIIGLVAAPDNCPVELNVEGCVNEGSIDRLVSGVKDPIQSNANTENIAGGIVGSLGIRDAMELQDFVGSERKVTIASENITYSAIKAEITGCENRARIIFNPYVGEDLFSKTCASIEISPNFSFTGGIVGMSAPVGNESYVEIRNCTNSGNIWSTSGMNGGIVGYLFANTKVLGTKGPDGVKYTKNEGLVYERDIEKAAVVGGGNGYVWSGGIVGGIPYSGLNHTRTAIEYCWNAGDVCGSSMNACPTPCAGGIVGYFGVKGDVLTHCKNSGHVRNYPHSGSLDFSGYLCGDTSVGKEGGEMIIHKLTECGAGGFVCRNGVWIAASAGGDFLWYQGVYCNDPVSATFDGITGSVCWDNESVLSWEE